jgi:hypothetical protein
LGVIAVMLVASLITGCGGTTTTGAGGRGDVGGDASAGGSTGAGGTSGSGGGGMSSGGSSASPGAGVTGSGGSCSGVCPCTSSAPTACHALFLNSDTPCAPDWSEARLRACGYHGRLSPGNSISLAQCGRYHSIVDVSLSPGGPFTPTDSSVYYDETGKLVGSVVKQPQFGYESCESYDPSFVRGDIPPCVPVSCNPPPTDAGTTGDARP